VTDPRSHDELQRFWDAVLRGEPAAPDDLDPALTETIRRLRALDRVPPPDPDFVTQAREDLMAAATLPIALDLAPPLTPNGRAAPPPPRVAGCVATHPPPLNPMHAALANHVVDQQPGGARDQPPADGGGLEPAADLREGLRDVHDAQQHTADQHVVEPDPEDPAGVGRGLVRVTLEELTRALQVLRGVGEPDVLPDEVPAALHVREELLGPPRLQRSELGAVRAQRLHEHPVPPR